MSGMPKVEGPLHPAGTKRNAQIQDNPVFAWLKPPHKRVARGEVSPGHQ